MKFRTMTGITVLFIAACSQAGANGTTDILPAPDGPVGVVISQPGHYMLVDNVTRTTPGNAIDVTTSNVTIDLNGYTLSGFGEFSGVAVYSPNVTVRNGTLRTFHFGCYIAGSEVTVEDCTVMANAWNGIRIAGANAKVKDCTVLDNGWEGIRITGAGATVEDCTVIGNSIDGIRVVAPGGRLRRIRAESNLQEGIFFATGAHRGEVSDSTVNGNVSRGIRIHEANNCVVKNNFVTGNTGGGIYLLVSSGCVFEANTIVGNSNFGIVVGADGNVAIGNRASGNSSNYNVNAGSTHGTIVTGPGSVSSNANDNIEF
jgi:parallel beta-helix repeat protein